MLELYRQNDTQLNFSIRPRLKIWLIEIYQGQFYFGRLRYAMFDHCRFGHRTYVAQIN